jgi:hypothetical protein
MEAHSEMSPTEDRRSNGNDVVAEAIAVSKRANELRDVAIAQLLARREQIDRDLQTLGYHATPNGAGPKCTEPAPAGTAARREFHSSQFKKLTLAQIGRLLLKEHGRLHGKEIERLARAGGFKSGTKNFQNYMPVAFKRDGGFENIGGNTWRLKETEGAEQVK